MKKLLIVGAVLVSMPFVSLAQTTTSANVQAGVTVNTTVPVVSAGFLPGDFFYFLDNFGEKIRLVFTFNKESKAKLHLEYAKERVAEIDEVLKNPKAKLSDIRGAKEDFGTQISVAASLIKEEKDKGADVAGLARELSDELDASNNELKDILRGHQDAQVRAEAEIRAKLAGLKDSEAPQLKGLTNALNAITKERGDSVDEENNLDTDTSDERAIFDEVMGKMMSEQRHMEQDKQKSEKARDDRGGLQMGMPVIGGTDVNEMEVNRIDKMMEGAASGEPSNETNDVNR